LPVGNLGDLVALTVALVRAWGYYRVLLWLLGGLDYCMEVSWVLVGRYESWDDYMSCSDSTNTSKYKIVVELIVICSYREILR
jgi:hypothetical protein